MSKKANETVEEWKHHFGWQIGPWSGAKVVAKILTVLVVQEFVITEGSTPRRERAENVRLETAEIREKGDVVGREVQVSS